MYYPKSQIKSNLYTSGGEYVLLSDSSEYIGYYHELSTGKKYTGKTPNSGRNKELVIPRDVPLTAEDYITDSTIRIALFNSDPDPVFSVDPEKYYKGAMIGNYRNLTHDVPNRTKPPYYYPQPTSEEYDRGEFQRYFSKRNNEYKYLETNKETFEKFQTNDPSVAFELYSIITLPWSLTGNIFSTNRNIVTQVERDNNWYGFVQYFNNNFSLKSSSSYSLYTNGGELLLPNRTNYVGYYHQMKNGTYMTGKSHGEGANIILIPLNPSNLVI